MKILISSDSYKDCLPAKDVGEYLRKGLNKVSDSFEIYNLPMADGGEGTVTSLVQATKGDMVSCVVSDSLMRKKETFYGVLGNSRTAVIEMAAASGIENLNSEERNPWLTTTYGTGELIKNALENNFRRIIIGLGGSSTIDGGVGMAMALGLRFLNSKGGLIQKGGGGLLDLERIDYSAVDKRLLDTEIIVACDVENPLVGKNGASYVYGEQKGADREMIKLLDRGLFHLASVVNKTDDRDLMNIPGAGAAGGLGFGLLAFCGAKLNKGVDIVAREVELEKHCKWADVVITGEGKLDSQTKYGKVPQGVANIAKKFNKPVFAVAGTLGKGFEELYNHGFRSILSTSDSSMSINESIKKAPELLVNTGEKIAKMLLLKKSNLNSNTGLV